MRPTPSVVEPRSLPISAAPALLVAVALGVGPSAAFAKGVAEKPTPALPVAVRIASDDDGKPACAAETVRAMTDEATRLFATMSIPLVFTKPRLIPARHAALETRDDRDALKGELLAKAVNVFVVKSLRDVDDPKRMRMGVHWRARKATSKHYAIVICDAAVSTLGHELGHFFGNAHTSVRDNVMSYDRGGGTVFFDAAQAKRSRRVARGYVATKEIVACTGSDEASCP